MPHAHVPVIMDGNGRWARQRHLAAGRGAPQRRRVRPGHRAGLRVRSGVKYLTLYAFSVENWNRPKDEVDTLMKYLARFLKNEIGELNRNNVKLEVGRADLPAPGRLCRSNSPEKTQAALVEKHAGSRLILALSYGATDGNRRSCPRQLPAKAKSCSPRSRRRSPSGCIVGASLHAALSRSRSAHPHQR